MLDFSDEVLEFKWKGKVYKLDYPTVKSLKNFQKHQVKDNENIDHLISFLCDLGGKKEVIESLPAKAITSIVKELAGGDEKK